MAKTIGFKVYETIGVGHFNPAGVKKASLSREFPIIMDVATPVAETDAVVKLYPGGQFEIMWRIGSATGGVCSYHPDREDPWKFPSIRDSEGRLPHELLCEVFLVEGTGAEDPPEDVRLDPFWSDFVREVETVFPIAEVMYR